MKGFRKMAYRDEERTSRAEGRVYVLQHLTVAHQIRDQASLSWMVD